MKIIKFYLSLFHGSATPLLVKSFSFFLLWYNHGYTLHIAKVKALYFPLARLACVARGVFWCVFSFVVFEAKDTDAPRKLNRGNALKQTPATQARAHLNFQFKV